MAFPCPGCGREFGDVNARYLHARAKHTKKLAQGLYAQDVRSIQEPSIADELVAAQIAHATGEPVEDWIKHMFPEAFR